MKSITSKLYENVPFYRNNWRTLNTIALTLISVLLCCVFGLIHVNWHVVLEVTPLFCSAFLIVFLVVYGIVQSRKHARKLPAHETRGIKRTTETVTSGKY